MKFSCVMLCLAAVFPLMQCTSKNSTPPPDNNIEEQLDERITLPETCSLKKRVARDDQGLPKSAKPASSEKRPEAAAGGPPIHRRAPKNRPRLKKNIERLQSAYHASSEKRPAPDATAGGPPIHRRPRAPKRASSAPSEPPAPVTQAPPEQEHKEPETSSGADETPKPKHFMELILDRSSTMSSMQQSKTKTECTFTKRPLGLTIWDDVDGKITGTCMVTAVTGQAKQKGIVVDSQLLSVTDGSGKLLWEPGGPGCSLDLDEFDSEFTDSFTKRSAIQCVESASLPVTLSFRCPLYAKVIGVNTYLEDQRRANADEGLDCRVTVRAFEFDRMVETVRWNEPIDAVPPLTAQDLEREWAVPRPVYRSIPGSGPGLSEALSNAIDNIERASPDEDAVSKRTVVIMTDMHTTQHIGDLRKRITAKLALPNPYTFVFLGAKQYGCHLDAIATAATYGIPRGTALTFGTDPPKVISAWQSASTVVCRSISSQLRCHCEGVLPGFITPYLEAVRVGAERFLHVPKNIAVMILSFIRCSGSVMIPKNIAVMYCHQRCAESPDGPVSFSRMQRDRSAPDLPPWLRPRSQYNDLSEAMMNPPTRTFSYEDLMTGMGPPPPKPKETFLIHKIRPGIFPKPPSPDPRPAMVRSLPRIPTSSLPEGEEQKQQSDAVDEEDRKVN